MKAKPPKALKNSQNFFTIFSMNARQAWFHKRAAWATVLSWIVRMGLTIILYYFIYKIIGKSSVNGVTFQIAASGMILYGIFIGFGYRDLYRIINREFKSGAIEIWLNKPVSYLQLKAAETLGKNIPVVVGLTASGSGFWILSGQFPSVDNLPARVLAAIPILLLGLIIAILLYIIVGLSVVWVLEAQPIFMIIDKLIMIFGGAFIPIGFFPPYLKLIGELLPTGAAMYITQMFYTNFVTNFPKFISVQIFWVIALSTCTIFMSKAANRNLTVNGG